MIRKPRGKADVGETDDRELTDLFRRHFESCFELEQEEQVSSAVDDDSSDSSEYSEYDPLSDPEDESQEKEQDNEVEVIKFDDTSRTRTLKKDKSFMTSKAPKSEAKLIEKPANASIKPTDSSDELKNDLALKRLIDESHILAEASKKGHYSGADISTITSFNPTGKARLKALNMRLESAGAASKDKFNRTPMKIRKGIEFKNKQKTAKYEREAKESGIILARPKKSLAKVKENRRDRGLKIASVGRNTHHGLVISESEIARVTSQGKRRQKKK